MKVTEKNHIDSAGTPHNSEFDWEKHLKFKAEQLEFILGEIIGIQKNAGKVRKYNLLYWLFRHLDKFWSWNTKPEN